MKNVFRITLLLTGIILILSSCSQISNISIMKSHNPGNFYIEPDANNKYETKKEDIGSFEQKGYSYDQTEKQEAQDTVIVNESPLPTKQPLLKPNVSYKREKQINADVNFFNPDDKGVNRYTKKAISEYSNKPNITQPVNYSRNSGHSSSNGVPFWLIVVFSFFIPPLGVALDFGITDKFWICLLLTLCFWLPGMIYAMIQIF